MSNLSKFTHSKLTELWDSTGSFFAFSDEQINEKMQPNTTHSDYVDCGHGLICKKDKAEEVLKGMRKIINEGIKLDIRENGKEAIIKRELYNYECFYVGDISDAVEALRDYNFTEDEIREVYNNELPNVEF